MAVVVHDRLNRCPKHPDHKAFIPVANFKMDHLPENCRTTPMMESIRKWVDRTAKVVGTYVSTNRPNMYPGPIGKIPYPLSYLKGSRRCKRIGTGFVENYILPVVEGKECPCSECRKSGNPLTQYWQFVVSTSTTVVYDESEIQKSVVELFYDSEDRTSIKYLYGTTIFGDGDDLERTITDKCDMICVTHDHELAKNILEILKPPTNIDMGSTGILISHIHGISKQISLGNFLSVGFRFLKKGKNYFRFPPGNDTQVKQFYDVLETNISQEQEITNEEHDNTTATLMPESFFLDLNITFPHFNLVQLESKDGADSTWFQFPPGTRFVTRDRKIIEVPKELEFDIDALYCYVTYNIATCPGSSGAVVMYSGKNFSHTCSMPYCNISGYLKAQDFLQTGTGHDDDDDTMSLVSTISDEGFHEYHANFEAMIESEKERPLNMLNDKIMGHLERLNLNTYNSNEMDHQDIIYHIQRYVEEESRMFPEKYIFQTRVQLEQNLNNLVFNEEFATEASNLIPEEILLSQESVYWAVRYLEDCQPCDQDGPYIYNTACRDTWFEQNVDMPRRLRGAGYGCHQKKINIYNVQNMPLNGAAIETESDFSFYYHGTNLVNAQSILDIGIQCRKGRPNLDYSDGDGFYVSSDFQQAADWARYSHGFAVVLVFKTPNDLFSGETKHLHIRATDLKTLAILKYFRSGCRNETQAISEIVNPTIDECESISGPILFNILGFRNNQTLILKSHQTCIRKQSCADKFYMFIDAIIFNP